MDEEQKSLLLKSSVQLPIPPANALILELMVFRAGTLAALRSNKIRSINGMVITASHNNITDNCIKIADHSGSLSSRSPSLMLLSMHLTLIVLSS